jgi:RimJ/RimL family protein N-acetyltransferase
MTPTLTTPRLILRPLEFADAPAAQALFPQWEIVRHLNSRVPWPFPADGVLAYYRDHALPAIDRGDEWHWSIRLQSNPGQLIGSIQLTLKGDANRGFWIGLPWQRRGYMTEACDAVTDFWFNTLRQPVLRVPKAAQNPASRRISEKQGMRLIRHEEHTFVSGRLPTDIWEITSEEWNARPRSS